MTDPQLPQPSPNHSVPPIPPAPGAGPGAGANGQHVAPSYQGPPAPQAPQQQAYPNPAPQTPPGAYAAPVGGYAAPAGTYQAPPTTAPKSAVLGVVAFVASIVAAIVIPIISGIAGYQIGFRLPTVMSEIDSATSDLAFLSPVRDQVLMGEIGFWVGTLAGLAAIVLGIMAIAKRQGRVWGVIALILGVIGPVIYFVVLGIALAAGASTGAVSQYS